MRHWIPLSLALISACAVADDTPRRFVPWSPLTEEEIAREKASRPPALNEALGDKYFRDPTQNHRFRERDIVKVYPELQGSRKLSSCSNNIMSGATWIAFVSHIEDHEVTLKTLNCSRARGGVLCGDVTTKKSYFLKSFREPIDLLNVPLDTAQVIAETYQARRVDDLPDWFEGGFPQLSFIGAIAEDRYRLIFSDYFCQGCTYRYDARLDTTGEEPRLVVVGNADGGCF
jgi:hypothetical protein